MTILSVVYLRGVGYQSNRGSYHVAFVICLIDARLLSDDNIGNCDISVRLLNSSYSCAHMPNQLPLMLQADVHIFDAQHVGDGPVASIHLPHNLPASLHGSFTPLYFGPDPNDETLPCWQEPTCIRQL